MKTSYCPDLEDAYRDLTVLVTGGTGFLGKWIVDKLLEWECTVIVAVNNIDKRSIFTTESEKRRLLHFFRYDLESKIEANLEEYGGRIDIIFHLAAAGVRSLQADKPATLRKNILGAYGIGEFAARCSVRRIVCAGSCFEYGSGDMVKEASHLEPRTAYAKSKILCRELLDWFGETTKIEITHLRPFTIYGPGEQRERLISHVIERLHNDEPLAITDGSQIRDFIFVEDVRDAFLCAGVHPAAAGNIFNVCTGNSRSVQSIVEIICDLLGADRKSLEYGKIRRRKSDMDMLVGDPNHIRETLDWQPTIEIREGLRRTIEWRLDKHIVEC